MREIDMIVIHCSATRCDRDYPFERLDSDHRSRGWNGCGYHRYITKDGTIYIGRPYEQVGAHVGPTFNPHSIGICYEGGLNEKGQFADTRTVAQKRSMAKLIWELSARFPKARILGHRDLPGVHKACPCFDVAKDGIAGTSSPEGVNLPPIRGRPSPGRVNDA
ncbi:MAG: N-acetylmuramoyl-L-alanine amidase [Prevotella sp.]|nr:N-acetylmuramoyl-L-alanine amidase [Prevotella sp.]